MATTREKIDKAVREADGVADPFLQKILASKWSGVILLTWTLIAFGIGMWVGAR